jgi:hypothetical protein
MTASANSVTTSAPTSLPATGPVLPLRPPASIRLPRDADDNRHAAADPITAPAAMPIVAIYNMTRPSMA